MKTKSTTCSTGHDTGRSFYKRPSVLEMLDREHMRLAKKRAARRERMQTNLVKQRRLRAKAKARRVKGIR